MNKYIKRYLITILLLLIFGSLMVFSTSWPYSFRLYGVETKIFIKHIEFVALSLIAIFVVSHINILKFKKFSKEIFIITFIMCFLVYSPLGRNVNNARRWIAIIGDFTIMPADFLKISSIMLMAYFIDRYKNKFTFKNVFLKYLLTVFLVVLAIMIQPDLSTTFVIVSTITAMYIVAGMDKKAAFFSLSGIILGSVSAIFLLKSGYSRMSRLEAFFNPLKYRNDKSWQLIKSLFAITNGSIFGVGLGNGRQKYTLSEAHNDFIFASIAEEFGFVGAILLIIAFIYLSMLGIKIANNVKNIYGKMIIMGITFSIGIQALVNIGTSTGIIPPTGVTLPFISYGGSSLVMTSVMVAIVLSIVRYSKER